MKKAIRVLFIATVLMAGCTAPEQKPNYLTVPEVWEDAPSLAGEQIRVRGWKRFYHSVTVQLCQPPSCDCNQSKGYLELLEEGLPSEDDRYFSMSKIVIPGSSLDCRGNECYMVCTPFDPTCAEAFEFVGRLRIAEWNENNKQLWLEDLDLEASRQLIDEEWVPIQTGRFTITLRTP